MVFQTGVVKDVSNNQATKKLSNFPLTSETTVGQTEPIVLFNNQHYFLASIKGVHFWFSGFKHSCRCNNVSSSLKIQIILPEGHYTSTMSQSQTLTSLLSNDPKPLDDDNDDDASLPEKPSNKFKPKHSLKLVHFS